jgi:hypothetical protein
MQTYDDNTLEPIEPELRPGEKLHVLLPHDETVFSVNEYRHRAWLGEGEQPLRKKGNGRAIHISDWICEQYGRLALNKEQLAEHAALPPEEQLKFTDAHQIIYPGKNHDAWWDMEQLMDQIKHAVPIFEYLFPGAVGIWVFDCASSHEAFSKDALVVKRMNVKPGGNQPLMHDTVIPLDNPPPKAGCPDMRGQVQAMTFPQDHPDASLCGVPKGLCQVFQERTSVWDALCDAAGGEKKVKTLCPTCKLSQKEKEQLTRLAIAERNGQPDIEDDWGETYVVESPTTYCCMTQALSQQQDFLDKRPLIQLYLESLGHICLFYPKSHCELNPIEMYWGWGKDSKPLVPLLRPFALKPCGRIPSCI